ncbi:unnamed protein product, partial [Mesorhabditis spiculigera]
MKRRLSDIAPVSPSLEPPGKRVSNATCFDNFFLGIPNVAKLSLPKRERKPTKIGLKALGEVTYYPGCSEFAHPLGSRVEPVEAGWGPTLAANYKKLANEGLEIDDDTPRSELFSIVAQYGDFIGVPSDAWQHRLTYAGHVINHVIQSRTRILQNKKLLEENESEETINACRDQGFARPCSLIMVPFRKDAHEIVELMTRIIFGDGIAKANIGNKKRFDDEFGDTGYRVSGARHADESFKEMMAGNVDDCFRVGIAFSKKEFKLYANFAKSDIILCSPLGLRMMLNGDAGEDSHYLSSIQIAVVDKCHILYQQNWEHVLAAFNWLNKKPSKIETDIRRVRPLYLEDHAKYYCQTLIFSEYQHEQFSSLAMRQTFCHRGLVWHFPDRQELNKVNVPICQEFHRVKVDKADDASELRFNYFKDKVLGKLEQHTLVFVPSYFDFVRLRNYMNTSLESFVQCHEYAPDNKLGRARDMFFHGRKKLLLMTERLHFYKRFHIRGVKNIVFYQLPSDPRFYSDIVNMACPEGERLKSILIYTPLDRFRLSNVFGQEMTNSCLKSPQQIQAIVSE